MLFRIWLRSDWIVLIKSEILITTGMVWPVSSDKWSDINYRGPGNLAE